MKRTLITTLCCLTLCWTLPAQHIIKPGTMRLSRTQSGHYAFNALLSNKVVASVMIESGIHAMLIDSAFYSKHRQELGITARPVDREAMNGTINLGGTVYRITHTAKGKIPMGAGTYEGEMLVLANYKNNTPITIPLQQLRNTRDWNSRIVMLDIEGGEMRMLTHRELREWQGKRYRINRNTYRRMPAIRTTIQFVADGTISELEGNFNIDLGNPMLLYLLGNQPKVAELLSTNSELKPRPIAYNADGKVAMQVFAPEWCSIMGNRFAEPTVCVTHEFKRFTSEGLIGLEFFARHVVAFDFDNNYLYIKE